MKEFTVAEILNLIPSEISYEIFGDYVEGHKITNAKPTLEAEPDSITFIDKARSDSEKKSWLRDTKARLVISDLKVLKEKKTILYTKEPKLLFAVLVSKMFLKNKSNFIHKKSYISDSSKIGKGCYIGANVAIEENVTIGENVWIGAKVTITDGVRIGNGSIIAAGAVISKGTYPENSIIGGVPARVIRSRQLTL